MPDIEHPVSKIRTPSDGHKLKGQDKITSPNILLMQIINNTSKE